MFDLFYICQLDYTTKTVKYKIKIRSFFLFGFATMYLIFSFVSPNISFDIHKRYSPHQGI